MVMSKDTVSCISSIDIVVPSSGDLRRVTCVLDYCSDSGTKGNG